MRDNDILDGKDDFVLWTPGCVVVDLTKSASDLEKSRPIGGTASTETLDRQEESVFAKGLDFSEFVHHGFFNDNHKQGTADIVGVPSLAELRKGRWWTEGNLLHDYEPADRIWALAKSLSKSHSSRRLGFSIEGKVIDRGYDNRILKAKIRHVAITNSPVNTDCTWDILAKSFGTIEQMAAGTIRRSLFAGNQAPNKTGVQKVEGITLDKAVKIIKSNRPKYSWATCEQLARIIIKGSN